MITFLIIHLVCMVICMGSYLYEGNTVDKKSLTMIVLLAVPIVFGVAIMGTMEFLCWLINFLKRDSDDVS
jgi:hypothetical protein